MRIVTAAAVVMVLGLSSVAHAGAIYGAGASETIPGGSPIIRFKNAVADMNGGPDATPAVYRNNTLQSGVNRFSVTWDVTGAGGLIHWRLYTASRSSAVINSVTLLDTSLTRSAVSTTRTTIATGAVASGAVTLFELTNYHQHSDYGTVSSGFVWNDIRRLTIEFELNNPVGTGTRETLRIDAISNPEPGTLALFGLGGLGLLGMVRRRRRRALAESESAAG